MIVGVTNNKVCAKCQDSLPVSDFRVHCLSDDGLFDWCKQCEKKYKKHWQISRKLLVLSHYGGSCAVCGINDPAFLTIDHTNNDGAEHRKEIGGSNRLYSWLINNDFPPCFQVLCWNHNHEKRLKFNRFCRADSLYSASMICDQKCRNEVISHYGGQCQCCGETNIDILTIDHINGGGNEHRRAVGGIHFWLRHNSFPPDFCILCWNCNCGRAINGGVCPHNLMVINA